MKTASILLSALFAFVALGSAFAQQSNPTDVTCTFADGKGMRLQYSGGEKSNTRGLPTGKAWTPNNKPMLLFLDTGITVGGTPVPLGAYSVFVIPGKADWTLVINRDVNSTKHDPSKDIAHTTMPTGELGSAEATASIYLAHIAPTQCNIRVVYGKTMAWGETHEKQP